MTTTATRSTSGTPASTVKLVPLPEGWEPPAGWKRTASDVRDGYRARIVFVLDIRARELSAHPVGQDAQGEEDPGHEVFVSEMRAGVVPPLLRVGGLHLSTSADLARPERVAALMEELAPLAGEILDNLLPVPGGPGWDWTVRAADALDRARHLADRYPYRGTEHDYPYGGTHGVDAAALFSALPGLIDPAWRDATDHQIQGAALDFDLHRVKEMPQDLVRVALASGTLPGPGEEELRAARVYGLRAWLHGYRLDQAGGLTPVDATRWDGAAHHALHVTDDSTDAELTAAARRAEQDAAARGLKLIGAGRWVEQLRADRRTAVREQLAAVRDEIASLEERLKPARKRRTVLVTRILGWEGERDTDSALGRDAGLSHTAVRTLRTALEGEEQPGRDEDEGPLAGMFR
ncbi:hypothetical protein [Streptomyces sp. NPDC058495]|uniref:hypothetical protein n=1 Tax=unclassified Streptomyces TaxID=2593676 RepID=UPI00365B070D